MKDQKCQLCFSLVCHGEKANTDFQFVGSKKVLRVSALCARRAASWNETCDSNGLRRREANV